MHTNLYSAENHENESEALCAECTVEYSLFASHFSCASF